MKVLFISSGNKKEGISPIIYNQGESLKRAGIEVDYFTVKGKGARSYIGHVLKLHKYLKKRSYDVYHAHYYLSGIIASFSGCNPLVVSLMGSDARKNFFRVQVIRLFHLLSWKALIFKTYEMQQNTGIKQSFIIPNGVDLDLILPFKRKVTSDVKTILFASDPARPSKNFSLARAALKLLPENKVNLRVIHSVPHQEIIEAINDSDILLITSRWEGSPNIVKEAMACNCPVVSTSVGDVEWLFGEEQGYYITRHDPADVAEKIGKAVDLIDKGGNPAGRQRIIELGLEASVVADRIIKVYSSVIESHG